MPEDVRRQTRTKKFAGRTDRDPTRKLLARSPTSTTAAATRGATASMPTAARRSSTPSFVTATTTATCTTPRAPSLRPSTTATGPWR
jgi:hypothetical protein